VCRAVNVEKSNKKIFPPPTAENHLEGNIGT